ncbi:MAG: PDZ domain-containing protein [Candidatus Manganitrophus sp.]|nr:MAG: PDZ domain-containing protein [Candidatus Manganitrophus sp.]
MGIDTQTLLPEFAEALSLPVRKGVMVARVVRGGPAHRAGIRGGTQRVEVGNAILVVGGDILVAVDGEEVTSAEAFHEVMKTKRPDDKIRLTLWRGREKRKSRSSWVNAHGGDDDLPGRPYNAPMRYGMIARWLF